MTRRQSKVTRERIAAAMRAALARKKRAQEQTIEQPTTDKPNGDLMTAALLAMDPAELFRKVFGSVDPWQAVALRSQHPRQLWNCSRQSGKSSALACLIAHDLLYATPPATCIALGPTERQTGEVILKVKTILRAIRGEEIAAAESSRENLSLIEMPSGNRALALPGNEPSFTRGFSPTLICIDESSMVSDELYSSLRPMLIVTKGKLVAASTPNGKRGWWYNAWISQEEDWDRVQVEWWQCPRIRKEDIEQERIALGPKFLQEYECSFISESAFRLFPDELIDAAFVKGEHVPIILPDGREL